MDEMRRNELYKPELRLESSKSNSVLSHFSSEYAQKTCHAPSLPWVNPACGGLSVSGAENVQFPLSSIQGKSTQACPDPAQTEGGADTRYKQTYKRRLKKKTAQPVAL